VSFSALSFCETVCGESGVFLSGAEFVGDFDWYELDVATTTELSWEVEGEFPVGAWIIDGRAGCEGAWVMASDWRYECEPFSVTVPVEPGVYWLVVGPVIASDLAACPAGYVARASRVAACPGDLDDDGDIDLSDLGQLLSNYGTTSGAEYEDGDLDCDRDVDLADLAWLLSNYGTCQTIRGVDPTADEHGHDREPRVRTDAESLWFDGNRPQRPSGPAEFGD
jgi:hypothetical protein